MNGLNKDSIKQAAAGRWGEIIPAVAGIDPAILNPKQHHPCPRCEGRDRFRAFDDFKQTGGVYCNVCHAEKNSDGLATVQWMLGCTFPDALRLVAAHLGIEVTNGKPGDPDAMSDDEFLAAVCAAKKMTVESGKRYGAVAKTWGNRGAGGRRVVEFPVYDQYGNPCGRLGISLFSKDEKLRKGKFAKGSKHGLFLPHDEHGKRRLPQPGETWLHVEGGKDAGALHGFGFNVAGLPTSHMAPKFARLFKGVHVVIVPDLDEAGTKGSNQTASRLKGIAASVKIARLPGELRDTDGIDCRDVLAGPDGEALLRQAIADAVEWSNGKGQSADDKRPQVLVSTDEYVTNDLAAAELANDPEIFHRGGQLVCVTAGGDDDRDSIHREAGQPRIVEVSKAVLRDKLTRLCYFAAETAEGEVVAAHPPEWCTKAVLERGYWRGVRQLVGVTASPIVRPDGSVVTARGYDRSTGLYLACEVEGVKVADKPTQADAVRAAAELLDDVVCDFPFERPEHRSAWVSVVITPLARHSFDGPAPLHVFDAATPGIGKTLAAEVGGIISLGGNVARMANPSDDDEARKRITALALAGDSLVLIDNVSGGRGLGCPALDAALTGTRWQDRVLGASQMIDLPLLVTWLASGNNVVLRADTSRRALHIRLRADVESPESRTGFRYPNLRAHVKANRGRLLSAALTILRAWFVAGRPQAKLPAWGSFEDWSGVVRQAIVFAGLPDPAATRQEFVASADRDVAALRAVLECWSQFDPDETGFTAGEIVKKMDHSNCQAMREALLDLCPPSGAAPLPTARQVGNKFGHLRGRVVGGRAIDYREERGRTRLWHVTNVSQPTDIVAEGSQGGDTDASGDTFPPAPYAPGHDSTPVGVCVGDVNKAPIFKGPGKASPVPPVSPMQPAVATHSVNGTDTTIDDLPDRWEDIPDLEGAATDRPPSRLRGLCTPSQTLTQKKPER